MKVPIITDALLRMCCTFQTSSHPQRLKLIEVPGGGVESAMQGLAHQHFTSPASALSYQLAMLACNALCMAPASESSEIVEDVQ